MYRGIWNNTLQYNTHFNTIKRTIMTMETRWRFYFLLCKIVSAPFIIEKGWIVFQNHHGCVLWYRLQCVWTPWRNFLNDIFHVFWRSMEGQREFKYYAQGVKSTPFLEVFLTILKLTKSRIWRVDWTDWPAGCHDCCMVRVMKEMCLTAHNWQKWKWVFLKCPCHEIYRDEAVGLKSCKYTLKITICVYMWNFGQFRENLIFCQ